MGTVAVYVADGQPLYLRAVSEVLRTHPGVRLCGASGDGRTALAEILELAPEVAIVDVRLPGLDGAEVARRLAREGAEVRVLYLTEVWNHDELGYDGFAAGGVGYLTRRATESELVEAVIGVANGETVVSPEAGRKLIADIRRRSAGGEVPSLAPRELQILGYIACGMTTPEIAARLHLSPATVKTHTHNLYRKLSVSDRASAVAEGMRYGLVD